MIPNSTIICLTAQHIWFFGAGAGKQHAVLSLICLTRWCKNLQLSCFWSLFHGAQFSMRCLHFFCSSPTFLHSDWGQEVSETVEKHYGRGLATVRLLARGKIRKRLTLSCLKFWLKNAWLFHVKRTRLSYLLLVVWDLMLRGHLQRFHLFIFPANSSKSKIPPPKFFHMMRS